MGMIDSEHIREVRQLVTERNTVIAMLINVALASGLEAGIKSKNPLVVYVDGLNGKRSWLIQKCDEPLFDGLPEASSEPDEPELDTEEFDDATGLSD